MTKLKTALALYSLLFILLATIGGLLITRNTSSLLGQIIFLPIILYLIFTLVGKTLGIINNIFLYYGFIITAIMLVSGILGSQTPAQLASAALFFPLALYFILAVIPKRKTALKIPVVKKTPTKEPPIVLEKEKPAKLDIDRRAFLKLIGTAGLTIFLFSIFTKRAHAAFFGSVPGPGTVAIKDTTGTQIDPAQHHPTDGYKISELDDSSPAFYGFIRKDGAWFIMKEGTSGDYRYTAGSSSFSTNWTNRSSLSYDYFHNVF
ncbi:hypothetical protein HYZ78_03150 [Candidatus Microgenomates bacterium]|nr:hypothetical protein [Candidatus Microgenomates bacterium]